MGSECGAICFIGCRDDEWRMEMGKEGFQVAHVLNPSFLVHLSLPVLFAVAALSFWTHRHLLHCVCACSYKYVKAHKHTHTHTQPCTQTHNRGCLLQSLFLALFFLFGVTTPSRWHCSCYRVFFLRLLSACCCRRHLTACFSAYRPSLLRAHTHRTPHHTRAHAHTHTRKMPYAAKKGKARKDKSAKKSVKTKRRARDIDLIHAEIQPEKISATLQREVDGDLPGLGQIYCVHCA